MLLTDIHPNVRPFLLVILSLVIVALLPSLVFAQQATLTDDAQTSTGNPNQNFGSKVSVQVSGTTFKGFLKFKLTPNLPTGTTGGQIEKATLKLFVTAVNTAGDAEVYRVAGAWDEGSITNNTAPALGSLLTSLSFDVTGEDRWVTVDITSLVKDWLDNVLPNNGIALVAAPGGLNVTLNSKENGTTSHEPVLEILLNHVATADHANTADNATIAGHATTADTANALSVTATVNGNQVNGALTNATIAGSSITGVVPISNGGTGSSTQNFVDLSTDQTVDGNKTFNGPVDTNAHYRIDGLRILSNPGTSNLFAGIAAGSSNTSGSSNSFFGLNAGRSNTSGSGNSFYGTFAGEANTTGGHNAFFGFLAGNNNTSGTDNSFFGQTSGLQNTTGNANSFFGFNSGGANTTGGDNAFFGNRTGEANTTGGANSFFGTVAGQSNTTGSDNSFFGQQAGKANTAGNQNSFFGGRAGQANTTGNSNSFYGFFAGNANTTGSFNSYFGQSAGFSNTTASNNAFFGADSGLNTTNGQNSFFGAFAGNANTSGSLNSFVGNAAGLLNTTGARNTFVGQNAGSSNTDENDNTFIGFNSNGAPSVTNATAIGANSTVTTSNTMVLGTNIVTVQVPGNLNVSGTFTGSIPAGSGNYIQNTTSPQASSNFNISGDGTVGGSLFANFVNALEYNIGGQRVMSNAGASNMFVGAATGASNTTGSGNSFYGAFAGQANTTGEGNSFFGNLAGRFNTSGSTNSFFGWTSGVFNTTGAANSFFGFNAGNANTTGGENAFFGNSSGKSNMTGAQNSFFGSGSGSMNVTGSGNAFFGVDTGQSNTSGNNNSFFGGGAGTANTTGENNSFFGTSAGAANSTARFNSIIGAFAGSTNSTGEHNSFFGFQAGRDSTGDNNAFFGSGAGENNSSGNFNTFYGQGAGQVNTTGTANTFVGRNAGNSNTTENNNTFIGHQANGAPGIFNATAIGANAIVNQSDTLVLGTSAITVQVPGNLSVANSFTANGSNLSNLNASNISSGTLDNARLGVVPIPNGGTGSSTQNFVDLSTNQTVAGNKSFTNGVTVGNSSNGGSLLVTNTVNRFLELGSNVNFDSFGTAVGIRLKSTHPLENYSYGILHGSNVFPGALIFRKDDESISPGDARNRLIIAGNGDVIVNSGSLGIGTTSPAHKLDVAGDANFTGSLRTGSHQVVNGNLFVQNSFPQMNLDNGTGQNLASFNATTGPGSTAAIGSVAGTSFVIRAGGIDSIFIDPNNQRVGVGTTSPTERLEVAGNLRVNGDFVATGTKSAVVTLSDKREVKLYAVESPGNWFEDFGSARLSSGVVTVLLDPLFAQTVNTDYTYHVFLTANGNCRGLYVAKKTATSFEVRELGDGRSEITFDYRIVARSRGYEQVTSR